MRQKPFWQQMALATAVMTALAAMTSGCFLFPKKKNKKGDTGSASLIVTHEGDVSAIFFDRIGDGDAAVLKFKTRSPAFCELAYYSQDPNGDPKKDSPKIQPCAAGDARTDFTEKFEGLRTDTLYEIIITAWVKGSDKAHGETVTVRETPSNSDGSGVGDGKIKDLLVARLDAPLMVAEFHRHSLPEALDFPTVKSKLTRPLGCRTGVPNNDAPFRDANPDIGIKNLLTRDFASGTAAAHPDQPGRQQTVFKSLNDGVEKWTLLYQLGAKDLSVPARPISRILNLEMESATIQAFSDPQLAEAEDPLTLDKTKPLKFSWTTGTLLDQSYLTVTIGRPDNDKAVYCVFDASKKTGVVDAKFLDQLEDGRQVVLAELNTNQIWAKDGWLISVYDWRSGRIEK